MQLQRFVLRFNLYAEMACSVTGNIVKYMTVKHRQTSSYTHTELLQKAPLS